MMRLAIKMTLAPMIAGLLLAAAAVTGSPTTAFAAGMEEEAGRQIDFAEDELRAGKFDAALKSAESALRLNPTLYDAFVLKALAYEGLGNPALAESLLVAYQELTKEIEDDPRVVPALERLRAARSEPARRGRTAPPQTTEVTDPESGGGKASPTEVEQDAGAETVASLDPAPYRQRVEEALDAGQCAAARAAASEFVLAQPRLPDGYRFLGDAARCDGRTREAVVAYRRYKELGGAEASVDLMLRGLSASLASIVALVELPSNDVVTHAALTLPTELLLAPPRSGGTFEFEDLPTGHGLVLRITGKGLRPTDVDISALAPGERREVPVAVEYIGLARVRVAEHDPSLCVTTLLTPDGDIAAASGSDSEVTAAEVVALVSGQYGEIEVALDVAPGAVVGFDPSPWVPTAITVVGVPSGSTLRVFVEGLEGALMEREIQVPIGLGTLDSQSGVMIAPPQRLDSLIGGVGGVFVEHPGLGEGNAAVVLEPGAANATTFGWRDLPGVNSVELAYHEWLDRRAQVRKRADATTSIFAGLAIGSGIASGILWALAADAGTTADGSKSLALTSADADAPDIAEIEGYRLEYEAAAERRRGAITGGSITAGIAGAGLVLSITFGTKGRRDVADLGAWDATRSADEPDP